MAAVACASAPASAPELFSPGIELPDGEGRAILEGECLSCHDLGGLNAYKGYYDAERWRGLILTMVDHGASLGETEVATLTDYLVEHFGPEARDNAREGE